jgi:tRNA(adenine34) deaminase
VVFSPEKETPSEKHIRFMTLAVELAKEAYSSGEVPVGSVIVSGDEVIGRGRNRMVEKESSIAHAEILAIKDAEKNNKAKFRDSSLYVTLEPCPMCMGAIILTGIKSVIYGTTDPGLGGCGSAIDIAGIGRFQQPPLIISGIMERECEELLKRFFKELRSGGINPP